MFRKIMNKLFAHYCIETGRQRGIRIWPEYESDPWEFYLGPSDLKCEIYVSQDENDRQVWRASIGLGFASANFPVKKTKDHEGAEFLDGPRYGFHIVEWRELNLSWGKWFNYIALPFSLHVVRSEILEVNGFWETEKTYNPKDHYFEEYHYQYRPQHGPVQHSIATVNKCRFIMGRKWVPFLRWQKVYIDVEFSPPIGDDTDSWKGGCWSCSWDMRHGETMEDALRRMESARRFR